VKGRSFAILGWCLLGIGLLSGCAGNQLVSDGFDATNRPQLFFPGANRAEVKGLAMGSARTKGWSIVQSRDDRLVMQRPVDPTSPSALALTSATSSVPPVIEITSAFIEQSGGVNVALGAAVVSQPPGEKAPKRIDYTENYRDALTQSLESLRSNWTANRQRVANAMPTLSPKSDPVPNTAVENNPLVQAWGETVAATTPSGAGASGSAEVPTAVFERTPTEAAPAPERAPASLTPTPEPTTPTSSGLQWSTSTPAPVVDGSSALAGGDLMAAPTPVPAARAMPLPQPVPETTTVPKEAKVAKPAATTAKTPSKTAAPAAKAAKAEPRTAKPAAQTAKVASKPATPGPKTAKTDAKTAKSEPKSVKTESKATKPTAKTAKTDPKTAKPEAKIAKADTKTAKPPPKNAKTDAKAAKPDAKSVKADTKTAKPEPKNAKTNNKAAKPEPKNAKTDSKAAKPNAKSAKTGKS